MTSMAMKYQKQAALLHKMHEQQQTHTNSYKKSLRHYWIYSHFKSHQSRYCTGLKSPCIIQYLEPKGDFCVPFKFILYFLEKKKKDI